MLFLVLDPTPLHAVAHGHGHSRPGHAFGHGHGLARGSAAARQRGSAAREGSGAVRDPLRSRLEELDALQANVQVR